MLQITVAVKSEITIVDQVVNAWDVVSYNSSVITLARTAYYLGGINLFWAG